ncbi:MAG: polysaccharide biosynthesis protein, partial [Rhodococcus sp. (in: high G+C Gram-positive bacteria)]
MNTVVSSYLRSAKSIDLGGTGFFRLVGLLAGACANFAVIAILSRDYGVEYYAFYALMASMLNLLPFADFGIGATMVNATADYRSGALDRMSFQSHFRRA